MSSEEVRQLLRVIDWLMELPPLLKKLFEQDVNEYEEEQRMSFVDLWEARNLRKMIEDALRVKFGEEAVALMPETISWQDSEPFLALNHAILTAATLDEARRACAKAAPRRKKGGQGKRGSSKS
jgi:hypothetical protein